MSISKKVMKSVITTESLGLHFTFHLKDTLPVVMEMNGIIRSLTHLFPQYNTFSDIKHGVGLGEF